MAFWKTLSLVVHHPKAAAQMAEMCEKCGSTEISTSYHEQGCTREGCNCAACGYNQYARRHTEHLHYVCMTCRFDWTGDVLSAAVPESSDEA